jgi:hypothetical protein
MNKSSGDITLYQNKFEFECPCAWEDVHVGRPFDIIPTVKVHHDCHQFIVHCFLPLSLEGASDGCVKRRGVVRFFCFFSCRAGFKNTRVSNVTEVDAVVPIVPIVNRQMISKGGETIRFLKPFVLQKIAFC